MKGGLGEKLIRSFCDLVSHQASLQDTEEEGRIFLPIEEFLDVIQPNKGGDFPLMGIKIPLTRLLDLNPSLGLTLYGYCVNPLYNKECLVRADIDRLAMLENHDLFGNDVEGIAFDFDLSCFEKAYDFYMAKNQNSTSRKTVRQTIFMDVNYPVLWLLGDESRYCRLRKTKTGNLVNLLKSLSQGSSLGLGQIRSETGYVKDSTAIRAISDLNKRLKQELKIEQDIILHTDMGYELNGELFEIKEQQFKKAKR